MFTARVGEVVSSTVTATIAVVVLLLESVAVKVTLFTPVSAHVKVLWERVNEAIAQLSVVPLSTESPVMVAEPVPSK